MLFLLKGRADAELIRRICLAGSDSCNICACGCVSLSIYLFLVHQIIYLLWLAALMCNVMSVRNTVRVYLSGKLKAVVGLCSSEENVQRVANHAAVVIERDRCSLFDISRYLAVTQILQFFFLSTFPVVLLSVLGLFNPLGSAVRQFYGAS